jgi:transposase
LPSFTPSKDIRGRSAEERRLIRQQKSRPLADAFEQWLRAKLGLVSQKGKLDSKQAAK